VFLIYQEIEVDEDYKSLLIAYKYFITTVEVMASAQDDLPSSHACKRIM
jgi:hypothetical protein